MSGPVHNHDHSFCPGFGQIGRKRPHCKPILGALLSWVIQDTTWPPKPSAFLDVVARRPLLYGHSWIICAVWPLSLAVKSRAPDG